MADKKQPEDIYTVGRTLPIAGTPRHPAASLPSSPQPTLSEPKKNRWKIWLILIMLVLLMPFLIIGIWDARNFSAASAKLFGSSNLLAGLSPGPVESADPSRVNIMIVGYSADDPGHAGANLTDSIMIVSLSNSGGNSYMLSVPRDLYVSIPGYGRAKINEAYQDGQWNNFSESGYPAGGMGLLEKTVAGSLGVHADYYAILDYTAVRDVTNALGGVTVNINSSDPRGIFDPNFKPEEGGPLQLTNGQQKIDGLTALRLTRARGAAGGSYGLAQSDFDRTKNQQAVFVGIKNTVSWRLLLDPTKNQPLLAGLANNVHTDIPINQVLPLYRLFNRIPSNQLKTVTLRDINGQNLLVGYTTPTRQSALIPAAGISDYSDITAAINSLNQ